MKFLLLSIAVFAALTKTLEGQQPVVEELTDDTFESYLTVSQLAIVDFYATWYVVVVYNLLQHFALVSVL